MKLRLRDNSMRIRFSQSEVRTLSQGGSVESATPFGPGQVLCCRVVPAGGPPEARLDGATISLRLPLASLQAWAAGSELSLEHEQVWQDGSLKISLEKDLACTHPRKGEDDSDAFSNPRNAG